MIDRTILSSLRGYKQWCRVLNDLLAEAKDLRDESPDMAAQVFLAYDELLLEMTLSLGDLIEWTRVERGFIVHRRGRRHRKNEVRHFVPWGIPQDIVRNNGYDHAQKNLLLGKFETAGFEPHRKRGPKGFVDRRPHRHAARHYA